MPILHIIKMLPWSKSRDTVDKLTVGSMARYTLASYAVRDAGLREYLRSELAVQPAAVKGPLTEVVQAADTVQLGAVRKDALAAVDELKAKGSDSPSQPRLLGPGRRRRGRARVRVGGGIRPGRDRHPLRDRRLGLAGAVVVLGEAAAVRLLFLPRLACGRAVAYDFPPR